MKNVPLIRIFLSSPSDVKPERAWAKTITERLQYRAYYRDRVSLRIVSWSDTELGTPLLANCSPQQAIDQGLPTPAECDIVIGILWSRIGTPFSSPEGIRYRSGTHYELSQAIKSEHTSTVLYFCNRIAQINPNDLEGQQQLAAAQEFRMSIRSGTKDLQSIGYNEYDSVEDFQRMFETQIEQLIELALRRHDSRSRADLEPDRGHGADNAKVLQNPYPGLRAFTRAQSNVFFGRDRMIQRLDEFVNNHPLVIVVGSSGSGKSSLIEAGFVPLFENKSGRPDVQPSVDEIFHVISVVPNEDIFESISRGVLKSLGELEKVNLIDHVAQVTKFARLIESNGSYLVKTIDAAEMQNGAKYRFLLHIDQFERAFYHLSLAQREAVVGMTAHVSEAFRVLVTLRSDHYAQAIELFGDTVGGCTFTVGSPDHIAIYEMITQPAELCGLDIDATVVESLVEATGSRVGALPLLASFLGQLHDLAESEQKRQFTVADYESLGGLDGAILGRIGEIMQKLDNEFADTGPTGLSDALDAIFRQLITIDDDGKAVCIRCSFRDLKGSAKTYDIITALVDNRLLTSGADDDGWPWVEIAHEILFEVWPFLRELIDRYAEGLRVLRQVEKAADEWDKRDRPDSYLWDHERMADAKLALTQLGDYSRSATLREFMVPEQVRILAKIRSSATTHLQRSALGARLASIGDDRPGVGVDANGIPEFSWVWVEGGTFEFEGQATSVASLWVSRYPVTFAQFEPFESVSHEYCKKYRAINSETSLPPQQTRIANFPRDSLPWSAAMGYCDWLNEVRPAWPGPSTAESDPAPAVRLPSEQEWVWFASRGEQLVYSWGSTWGAWAANTREAGLSQTTAVGMYPDAASRDEVEDLCGNICEWCLNKFSDPWAVALTDDELAVRKGGSCNHPAELARVGFRFGGDTEYRFSHDLGFRVVRALPIELAVHPPIRSS